MVSLIAIFWMFVLLFAIIGAARGWGRELLVTFSLILALFLIYVMETNIGVIRRTFVEGEPEMRFWFRTVTITLLVFFGYQTPNIRAIARPGFVRQRIQDTLLGVIIGAFNGYLVVGSIWFFLHQAGYPFPTYFGPAPTPAQADAINRMMEWMPPDWLMVAPWIYVAVGIAFLFVIVVFI